ncbi:MAG: hypothetical protein ACREPX_12465 [Rhodanobacteraceae bacterium]
MIRTLLAIALALTTTVASAEIVTIRYNFPETAGLALTYGYFGGERGPTTGHILSTTLVIDYTTSGAQDAADFYFTFDVPTLGAETHIGLTGADLGWSGQGTFTYSFEDSEVYNGEIRPGRFGAEFDGGGAFTDSYLEFVVDADPLDPVFSDGFEAL